MWMYQRMTFLQNACRSPRPMVVQLKSTTRLFTHELLPSRMKWWSNWLTEQVWTPGLRLSLPSTGQDQSLSAAALSYCAISRYWTNKAPLFVGTQILLKYLNIEGCGRFAVSAFSQVPKICQVTKSATIKHQRSHGIPTNISPIQDLSFAANFSVDGPHGMTGHIWDRPTDPRLCHSEALPQALLVALKVIESGDNCTWLATEGHPAARRVDRSMWAALVNLCWHETCEFAGNDSQLSVHILKVETSRFYCYSRVHWWRPGVLSLSRYFLVHLFVLLLGLLWIYTLNEYLMSTAVPG